MNKYIGLIKFPTKRKKYDFKNQMLVEYLLIGYNVLTIYEILVFQTLFVPRALIYML